MAVPGPPPAISASDVTSNSAFVSMADGATGGKPITVRQFLWGTNPTAHMLSAITGNTHTLTGLSPSTRYYVWARCGNADGWGPTAGPISFVTDAVASPPGPVPALSYSDVTDTSVFISYADGDPNGSPINRRQFAFGYEAGSEQFVYEGANAFTLQPLQPGMRYYGKARVANANGWGPWSYNITWVMAQTNSVPGAPAAISVSDIMTESVFVAFSEPNEGGSPITVRQIAFGYTPESTQFIWDPGPNGRTAKIQPLQPNTLYYFMARAGSNNGWGPWSPTTSARTLPANPPGAVPAVSLGSVTADSIFVSFRDGDDNGSPITRRQIAYGTKPDSIANVIETGTATTAIAKPLQSNTQYYFQARVANKYGWGPWSANATAKTLINPPGPPSIVTLSNVTRTSVTATFTPPPVVGGIPILEMELAYGLIGGTPTIVKSNGTSPIANLTPGMKYAFTARAKNQAGWGEWGPVGYVVLRSGVYVVDAAGIPHDSIAYVTVNGVPRRALPWVKLSGFWRQM